MTCISDCPYWYWFHFEYSFTFTSVFFFLWFALEIFWHISVDYYFFFICDLFVRYVTRLAHANVYVIACICSHTYPLIKQNVRTQKWNFLPGNFFSQSMHFIKYPVKKECCDHEASSHETVHFIGYYLFLINGYYLYLHFSSKSDNLKKLDTF